MRRKLLAVLLAAMLLFTTSAMALEPKDFSGGALSGIAAALLGIINNAPGTASPIPGMLAPFAFNSPLKVLLALALAAAGGIVAGFAGSIVFRKLGFGNDVVPD